jgi:hypothetical protein
MMGVDHSLVGRNVFVFVGPGMCEVCCLGVSLVLRYER